jgi:hypothetical protein
MTQMCSHSRLLSTPSTGHPIRQLIEIAFRAPARTEGCAGDLLVKQFFWPGKVREGPAGEMCTEQGPCALESRRPGSHDDGCWCLRFLYKKDRGRVRRPNHPRSERSPKAEVRSCFHDCRRVLKQGACLPFLSHLRFLYRFSDLVLEGATRC